MSSSSTPSVRRARSVAIIAAPVLASLAVLSPTSSASAAEIPDAISNITVTDSGGATPVRISQQLKVTADWSVPDNSAPGDTFSMTLPQELRGLIADFPLNDESGATFGRCTVSAAAVSCTLSDLVASRPLDVGGSLYFSGQFTDLVEPGAINVLRFDTGNTVLDVPVEVAAGVPYNGNGFRKGGRVQGDGVIRWYVDLPAGPTGQETDLTDVVLTETLSDNLAFTGPEGIVLRSATTLTGSGGVPNFDEVVDRADYTVEVIGKTATIRIPLLSAQVFYSLTVDTRAEPGASGTFVNRAQLTATGLNGTENASSAVEYGAGGDGSGSTRPSLTVTKFDTLDGDDVVSGDHDAAPGRETAAGTAVPVTITVTSTGGESLSDIEVTDVTTSGPAMTGLDCVFPDGSTGTTWVGPLLLGVSFDCTGSVPAMADGIQHSNTATATAVGSVTGTVVTAEDSWNGFTPVGAAVGGTGTDDELAATGVSADMTSGLIGTGSVAVLGGVVLLALRRKQAFTRTD